MTKVEDLEQIILSDGESKGTSAKGKDKHTRSLEACTTKESGSTTIIREQL